MRLSQIGLRPAAANDFTMRIGDERQNAGEGWLAGEDATDAEDFKDAHW